MTMNFVEISKLGHTWLIDLDGTIVQHNGHKKSGDKLLPGISEFWKQIPEKDVIIVLSARLESEKEVALSYLQQCGLRYDHAIFNLPHGERILINDKKPSGLLTAISINVERDNGIENYSIALRKDL
ncbi:hypothetical protein [Polynucleobacter necessarius]|uniref:hypothetical protein n=1 Tax=Polynucleobacter necessarius TaxID=576610 RepID=UPI000E095C4A|nr:hypothetical protein [Polynucleobacter necessarius]